MNIDSKISRRQFLQISATVGGGLLVGVYLPARAAGIPDDINATDVNAEKPFAPNAWIRIAPDNTVTIVVDKSEMGQGVMTALPMLVAEELDVDLAAVKLAAAPAAEEYKNPKLGMQATGGSTSVAASWERLRLAGAGARALLVDAAAQKWNVAPDTCTTAAGQVIHAASNRRANYGELAAMAADFPSPDAPTLKSQKDFKLIGKATPRLDTPDKVDGSAQYGIDMKIPNMSIATIAHPPAFGGKLKSFNTRKAKAVPGVHAVVKLDSGLAVVAKDYWTALKGLKAAAPQWIAGKNGKVSSASIDRLYREAAKQKGAVAHTHGDAQSALTKAHKKLNAVYRLPYAAHATMEPMNCTAHVRQDGCDVWVPTQSQTGVQITAAKITGLPQEKIQVHTTLLGCGFGRRFEQDFVAEAVQLSKTVGTPVKLIWSREEDMTHDFYRPAVYNVLHAGLDDSGMPIAWTHRIVTASIMGRAVPKMVKNGIDPSSVEGAAELPYAIPNIHVDYVHKETGVPVGFWRSVGNSHTAFVKESFVDELAAAAGQDPVEYRRRLFAKDAARERAVLELAVAKSDWGKKLPAGRAHGVAVHKSFGSYVAQVAEVSFDEDGVHVHRVVCAADCGTIVNPNIVRQQMEGAIVYGLTAALKGPITIENGGVKQRNFDSYPMLRLPECPAIEVHLIDSTDAPSGVGEPGVPPLAPAVTNALFTLTGKRIRELPIDPKLLKA